MKNWKTTISWICILVIIGLLIYIFFLLLVAEKGVAINFFPNSGGFFDIMSSVGTVASAISVACSLTKLTTQIDVAKKANDLQTRDIQTQTILSLLRQSNDQTNQYNRDSLEHNDDDKKYHKIYLIAQHVVITNICVFYSHIMNKEDEKLYTLFHNLLTPMVRQFVNNQFPNLYGYLKQDPNQNIHTYMDDAIVMFALDFNTNIIHSQQEFYLYKDACSQALKDNFIDNIGEEQFNTIFSKSLEEELKNI